MSSFIVHFLVSAVMREKRRRNVGWKKSVGIANGDHKLALRFILLSI